MKKKDKTSLASLTRSDLVKYIGELEQKLTAIMLDRDSKPSKNSRESKFIRQKLAVAHTVSHQKEILHG